MNYIKSSVKALRPLQWLKNAFVLLPLIFSGNLFNIIAAKKAFLAFVAFCAISSATYIINDYADRKKDRAHPEKSQRPIANGEIGFRGAALLVIVCAGIATAISLKLHSFVTYTIITYFISSQIYTFWLKNEPFADIILISTNFVLRAISGAFAIGVHPSAWMILGVFFLALYIAVGKRKGESMLLKNKAGTQRSTLLIYSEKILSQLTTISSSALLISYSLFVFFGEHDLLYLTLPFALYSLLRYDFLVSTGSEIARHPHYIITDKRLFATIILWLLITIAVIY